MDGTETDAVGGGEIDPATDPPVRTVTDGNGRTIAYATFGDPSGDPVCLFHGTPGSRLLGALFDGVARERGLRVLAVDRPGYGRSDSWRGRTLADTAAFVDPVLDDADVDEVGAIGFSGGGPHALAFAATRPERVRSVDLVAGASPADCVTDQPRPQRILEALAARTPRLLGALLRAQAAVVRRASPSVVVSQYTADPGAVPDDVAELLRRDFLAAVGSSRNGVVTESRLFGRPWDVPLDAVVAPVRLWHGEADGNVPVAAARRFADRLREGDGPRDVDLTVLDGADHLATLLRSREQALDHQADAVDRA